MISPSSIHFASSSSSRSSLEAIPSFPPPSYAPPGAHFVIHHPSSSAESGSSSTVPRPPSSFSKSTHPTSTFVHRDEDTIVPQLLFSREVDFDHGTQEGFAMGPLGEGGPARRTSVDDQGRPAMEFGGNEERWALAAVFSTMALAGWNDSSIGPLLLAIGEHYKISYLALSSIFICRFIGYSLAGMLNVWLNDLYGFGRVITFGACFHIVAYAIQSSAPPFPVLCLSYIISGVGIGFQDTQSQAFTARLPNMISKMSFLHAAFGVGAFISPVVSTQFAQMPHFEYYYLLSLGFAFVNLGVLIYVFRFRTEESLLGPAPVVETTDDPSTDPLLELSSKQKLKQILSTRIVHIYAAFLFLYVGLEITVGSYIVTFFVKTRDGGAQSGLVSSGFFLGLTLGRLVFVPLNRRLGEKTVTLMYTMAALGLECIVWFVPSLIGNAIAVAFVGLVLGPMYPMVISALTKMLPRHLHSAAVGWVASASQGGGALFPFLTGILASKRGIEVVPAVIVGILGAMLFFWVFTPKVPRRLD